MLISSLCLCFIFLFLCVTLPSSLPIYCHYASLPSLYSGPSPPCCLVKMTEWVKIWWNISCHHYELASARIHPHTLTQKHTHACIRTTERLMHHIKVSWVSVTVMSLISDGYQSGDCHTLQHSTARTFPWEVIGIVVHTFFNPFMRMCSIQFIYIVSNHNKRYL